MVLKNGPSIKPGLATKNKPGISRATVVGHRKRPQLRLLQASGVIAGLFILPKPGVVALTLAATYTGLCIASRGMPAPDIAFWTLLGLGLAAGGAATLNNFLDRDIDRKMKRTQGRSLPSESVTEKQAYLIGTVMVTASLLLMKIFVSALVAFLTGAAIFTYVVLYSMYLKRETPFATHIGGVAGALPPLIGYAAVHNALDIHALIIFLIIILWQQPHFWALALEYRNDYAMAGIPILPLARGVQVTKVKLFHYTLALLPVSMMPYFLGMCGVFYLITTIAMGLLYLFFAARFLMSEREKEMFLFFFSIVYLTVIFAAMLADMT